MKIITAFLAAATLATSLAYSEEAQHIMSEQQITNYHRVYFGPDFFGSRQKFWHYDVKVEKNTWLAGVKTGYDYVKPSAFYFGADGLVAYGNQSITQTRYGSQRTYSPSHLFANLETRYGYTFGSPLSKSAISPFLGLGWFHQNIFGGYETFTKDWAYGAVGIRANQQFRENFDVGFTLKGTCALIKKPRSGCFLDDLGYEAAFPFSWRVGRTKKWDVQVQPYILKAGPIDGTFFGTRFLSGYSF